MTGFDPADDLDAGEAVHPHGQMLGVIFDHAQGQDHGNFFVDGFTDLVRQHVQILHFLPPCLAVFCTMFAASE